MGDIFFGILTIVLIISVVLFGVSFIMLFFESQRKLAVKIMIGCVITFVIGFGACIVGIKIQ